MYKVNAFLTPGLTPFVKEQQNKQAVTAALLAVGVFFTILGTVLMQVSFSSSVLYSGYGFIYHFLGVNALGIGVMTSVSAIGYAFFSTVKFN